LIYSGADGVAADDVMNRATSQRAYASIAVPVRDSDHC